MGEENGSSSSSSSDSRILELETALTEQREHSEDLLAKLRYAHADAENSRKRREVDLENARNYGIQKFAKNIVEVADNLSRALETVDESKLDSNEELKSLHTGVKLTDDELLKALKQYDISKINPMGEKFDPKWHEAMFQVDSPEPKDTIVHLMQPGWRIKEGLLRAAR